MAEALKLVKQEFGSDAVILSAKSVRSRQGVLGVLKKPAVQVTAATDRPAAEYPSTAIPETSRRYLLQAYTSENSEKISHSKRRRSLGRISGPSFSKESGRNHEKNQQGFFQEDSFKLLEGFEEKLVKKGFLEKTASMLVDRMKQCCRADGPGDLQQWAMEALSDLGVAVSPIRIGKDERRIVALVGSTGVGKTTTVIKLAAMFAKKQGLKTAMITLDTHRIGAVVQLETYARILGIPLAIASDAGEMADALALFSDKDLVLLDTPGISPANHSLFSELKGCLKAARPDEVHLLLGACTQERDLASAMARFQPLGVNRILFTKIDEGACWGNLLNQSIQTQVPVSYLSAGQEIPEDVEPASIKSIARLLISLSEENRASFRRENNPNDAKALRLDDRLAANRKTGVFHLPQCRLAKLIHQRSLVHFKTKTEAEEMGFHPCPSCMPNRQNQGLGLERVTAAG
jgi:flagellar biosynthesis protein FlhF